MGPAEAERFLGRPAVLEAVDQAGGEAVAAADAVDHVELDHRADEALAVEPEDGRPVVAVGRVDLAEGRRHELDVGVLLDNLVDQREEGVGVKLRFRLLDVEAGDPQPFLQVFLVADQRVHVLDDPADRLDPFLSAADGGPELGTIVQVERGDRARRLGGLHPLDD